LGDALPVESDDGQDGAELDGDRVRIGCFLGAAGAQADEPLRDEQVPGGRHGQVFGDPFDRASKIAFGALSGLGARTGRGRRWRSRSRRRRRSPDGGGLGRDESALVGSCLMDRRFW